MGHELVSILCQLRLSGGSEHAPAFYQVRRRELYCEFNYSPFACRWNLMHIIQMLRPEGEQEACERRDLKANSIVLCRRRLKKSRLLANKNALQKFVRPQNGLCLSDAGCDLDIVVNFPYKQERLHIKSRVKVCNFQLGIKSGELREFFAHPALTILSLELLFCHFRPFVGDFMCVGST
jgi:hypothetical protein